MSGFNWLTRILTIIGGLNWGLIGLADYNLVAAITARNAMAEKIVYSVIGIAALYELIVLAFRQPVIAGDRRES